MNKDTHVVEAHTTAAQEHENTAKSHRAAAEQCSKGPMKLASSTRRPLWIIL
jgi:hypothetical protein